MAKKNNKLIESADEMYNVLTGDAELKRLEEIRMMSYMEEQAALDVAKREGMAEGESIRRKTMQEETEKNARKENSYRRYCRINRISQRRN